MHLDSKYPDGKQKAEEGKRKKESTDYCGAIEEQLEELEKCSKQTFEPVSPKHPKFGGLARFGHHLKILHDRSFLRYYESSAATTFPISTQPKSTPLI